VKSHPGQSITPGSTRPGIVRRQTKRQLQGWYEAPGDAQFGYTVPNLLDRILDAQHACSVGPWRGVNTNQNAVYMECFTKECARAGGKDSLEFAAG